MISEPQKLPLNVVQSSTFFDLLAILCCQIQQLSNDRKENIYRIFSTSYSEYNRSVREQFPFLTINDSETVVYYYSLTPDQTTQILTLLGSAKNDADWVMLLAVIKAIDLILEPEANLKHFLSDKSCPILLLNPDEEPRVSNDYCQFDSLNLATRDYGLILPQVTCRWQRPSDRTINSVGFHPLSVMKNYLWVRPDLDYRIVNLYSDFRLAPDQHLKLVTSPLCSRAPFLLHCHPESSSFEIEYLEACIAEIDRALEKAIHISAAEQADIAMFPEIMASPASICHCVEYIRKHWELDMPKLILLPTCEYTTEQGWVNELIALDADGGCIFAYHKQHPFRFEAKPVKDASEKEPSDEETLPPAFFDEPIQADHVIYLLHVPGIGRIGYMICSDVFRDGYLDVLLRDLKVTLLLHIVYSPGTDLLERMLAAAKQNMCDVVVCNACAAWDNPLIPPEKRSPVRISDKPLINKYYPYGHKYSSPQPSSTTCTQQECLGCAFVVNAANKYGSRQISVIQQYE